MSAGIKRYKAWQADAELDDEVLVIKLDDHLASHAFDEAVELALCEKYIQAQQARLNKGGFMPMTRTEESAMRGAWKECAKSRAKRAGGAE